MSDLSSDSDDDDFQSADEGEDIDFIEEKVPDKSKTVAVSDDKQVVSTTNEQETNISGSSVKPVIEGSKKVNLSDKENAVIYKDSVKSEILQTSEKLQRRDDKVDKLDTSTDSTVIKKEIDNIDMPKTSEDSVTEEIKHIKDTPQSDPSLSNTSNDFPTIASNSDINMPETSILPDGDNETEELYDDPNVENQADDLLPKIISEPEIEDEPVEQKQEKTLIKGIQDSEIKETEKCSKPIDSSNVSESITSHEEQPPEADNLDTGDVIVDQPGTQNFEDNAKQSDQEDDNWDNEGWGWDAFENVISSATTKVSAVVEKVEASLGIPNPSEFVSVCDDNESDVKIEKQQSADDETKSGKAGISGNSESAQNSQQGQLNETNQGFGSWFSGFGTQLVTGSVGALEFIGKKTIDVLSEGDPGLRKKRGKKGPSLSQMLREAQEQKESAVNENNEQSVASSVTFATEFERFNGIEHLQTLEVLSNESERKLERILNIQSEDALLESKEMILILNRNFTLHEGSCVDVEDNHFGEQLQRNCDGMKGKAALSVKKLIQMHSRLMDCLHKEHEITDEEDLKIIADKRFKTAISGLAEMTARCLELSHKTAEVLFADDVKAKSMCLTRASLYRKNTEILRNELSSLASLYAHRLDEIANKSESRRISFLVTDIHLEGANCCTYMEDCHRLVLPILQLSAIR